jgi:hypothetical protein
MAKNLFSIGGCGRKAYDELKRQAPNCTCTHDDYAAQLHPDVDCPVQGERCENCARVLSECPADCAGQPRQCQVTRTVGGRVDRCSLEPEHDGTPCAFPPHHAYGSANCRCEKTGPERTWNNALDCPLHGPQDVAVAADTYRPPPTHYAGAGGIDPWTFIRAHGLDYWQGNIIKYVTRAGKKDGESKIKDLEKARDFLNYLIEMESSP